MEKAVSRADDLASRLPPHSPEAERGVLGCILQAATECLGDAREALPDSAAFYDMRHRVVFEMILELDAAHAPIDSATVYARLVERGMAEQIGGSGALFELENAAPSPAGIGYWLQTMRDKFLLRRWIGFCTQTAGQLYETGPDVDAVLAAVSADLFKLCEGGIVAVEKSMAAVMADVQEEYFDKFRRGVKRRVGPQTGFNYLDNILPGLAPGQLILIAARPRTGKSAIIMQWAEYIAGAEQIPVGIFSLEMTSRALGARAVFERGGADMTKFLNGFMSDADVQALVNAQIILSRLPITFDESPSLSIEDLEIRARRMVRRHKLGVIFIDYFQLLWSRNKTRGWNSQDELAHCSKRLKALARELKIPIVVCAQMNREIEKETHRRPRLSDLRDTGQLEQDADVVMFLWKPDVSSGKWQKELGRILPRVPCIPAEWRGTEEKRQDKQGRLLVRYAGWQKNLQVVTCTVEKQREGRSGEDATLVFIKPWTRFVDAYEARKDDTGDLLPTGAPTEYESPDTESEDDEA